MTDGWYRFIGADGSMGLVNGNKYQLVISPSYATERIAVDVLLTTSPVNIKAGMPPILPTVWCPYDTAEAFNKNWTRA